VRIAAARESGWEASTHETRETAMQTIDNVSRVRIQRRRDSDPDPLHGLAGRVTRRRGRGEQTYRQRRVRGALACELRQIVADGRARCRRRGESAVVLPREAALLALAKRLDSDAPVAPDGIDRVRALIADSRRALDNDPGRDTLDAEPRAIDGR
jgi:hypothetical protein